MMRNKFTMKPETFHLPSREIQTNSKYFINFNCTICNAPQLFENSKFSNDHHSRIATQGVKLTQIQIFLNLNLLQNISC